jgi:hypothetical protein
MRILVLRTRTDVDTKVVGKIVRDEGDRERANSTGIETDRERCNGGHDYL